MCVFLLPKQFRIVSFPFPSAFPSRAEAPFSRPAPGSHIYPHPPAPGHRHKAQAGEQVCQKHAVHVASYQLKEAADAGLAGSVLFNALARLEIVCRRKQTHNAVVTSFFPFRSAAGRHSRKAPLCWLYRYKYTRILSILQGYRPSNCKKSIFSPFFCKSMLQWLWHPHAIRRRIYEYFSHHCDVSVSVRLHDRTLRLLKY